MDFLKTKFNSATGLEGVDVLYWFQVGWSVILAIAVRTRNQRSLLALCVAGSNVLNSRRLNCTSSYINMELSLSSQLWHFRKISTSFVLVDRWVTLLEHPPKPFEYGISFYNTLHPIHILYEWDFWKMFRTKETINDDGQDLFFLNSIFSYLWLRRKYMSIFTIH